MKDAPTPGGMLFDAAVQLPDPLRQEIDKAAHGWRKPAPRRKDRMDDPDRQFPVGKKPDQVPRGKIVGDQKIRQMGDPDARARRLNAAFSAWFRPVRGR